MKLSQFLILVLSVETRHIGGVCFDRFFVGICFLFYRIQLYFFEFQGMKDSLGDLNVLNRHPGQVCDGDLFL